MITTVLLGVVSSLIAVELWGSAGLLGRLLIRLLTLPLEPRWREVRRGELASLLDACKGDRRLAGLLRLAAIALRMLAADLGGGRWRRDRAQTQPEAEQPLVQGRAVRALLGVAGVDRRDIVTHSDRLTYTTVGLSALMLGGLAFFAVLSILAPAGVPLLERLAFSVIFAVTVVMMDRSSVAVVSRRRRWSLLVNLLAAFAFVVPLTQSLALAIFRADIAQVSAHRQVGALHAELETVDGQQAAQLARQTRQVDELRAEVRAARAGRRDGGCGPICALRQHELDKSLRDRAALGDPYGVYARRKRLLNAQITHLREQPGLALRRDGPLEISQDLYALAATHTSVVVSYVMLATVLLLITMSGTLTRVMAANSVYEQRQCLRREQMLSSLRQAP
jgi:hypothetical protein